MNYNTEFHNDAGYAKASQNRDVVGKFKGKVKQEKLEQVTEVEINKAEAMGDDGFQKVIKEDLETVPDYRKPAMLEGHDVHLGGLYNGGFARMKFWNNAV